MERPCYLLESLEIIPSYSAHHIRQTSEPPAPSQSFPLLACTAEGEILSPLVPFRRRDNADAPVDGCFSIEDVASPDMRLPSLPSEHEAFTSEDLPLPHSHLALSSTSVSPALSSEDICSSASSAADEDLLADGRSSLRVPCCCPFNDADQIIVSTKDCALAHCRMYGPEIAHRMEAIIDRHLAQAYDQCVSEIRTVAEDLRPSGWLDHDSRFPTEQYSGHVQPWMRASAQRHACLAVNAAFHEIDEHIGLDMSARLFSEFEIPGTSILGMEHYPCQCKGSHAMDIASRVFEDTVAKLDPFVSILGTLTNDSVNTQSRTQDILGERIWAGMLDGLKEIAEACDMTRLCSGHEMSHVEPWMTHVLEQHCQSAANAEAKKARGMAKEMHFQWYQNWLETLYRQDIEEDAMKGKWARVEGL
ncbi:MAG: hypothetical protein HETSPECPRED_003516 [Heterodermia speciosa]|uniref:Uncharacterized protein n=1 Tax=Heterodermia speciosa TaxID=116794 RepID=A0A8H3F5R7_9LECA|nr:MAG: hypothetical protein HETSPECPRED_003516 [Heterodermia speciosa]